MIYVHFSYLSEGKWKYACEARISIIHAVKLIKALFNSKNKKFLAYYVSTKEEEDILWNTIIKEQCLKRGKMNDNDKI